MKNTLKKSGQACLFALTLLLLSMGCSNQPDKSANEKLVRGYYAAYEQKDWNKLNSILADGFAFNSPRDNHINLAEYKIRCWPNSVKIKRFDIEKLMVEGDDAFVTYNGWTNDGRVFRNTEYFKFAAGKIKENSCYFGPGISFPNNTQK